MSPRLPLLLAAALLGSAAAPPPSIDVQPLPTSIRLTVGVRLPASPRSVASSWSTSWVR